jgi:dolichol-phosphate mannosyltransferase
MNSRFGDAEDASLRAAGGQVPAYRLEFAASPQRTFCVVIPVINEGERLQLLLDRMAHLQIAAIADIIVVDGGSSDGSVAAAFLQSRAVAALLTKTGPGKLSAQLRCAYAFALQAGYEGIVTIDGNNKDDPEAIPRFVEALRSGVDFVQASRYIPGGIAENTPPLRRFAIRAIHAPALSIASGFQWTDTTQGFRAYSRSLLLDPRIAAFRDVFMTYELLAYLSYRAPRLGFRCVELPAARRYPGNGKIPTKISSVRGNLELLRTLFRVCSGKLNPSVQIN